MKAEDLNFKIDKLAQEVLIPKGFKKSGLHYFKIENNQFYGLIKDTYRGSFEDYFLVYSHECAGEFYNSVVGKVSVMLKDYPVSVRVTDLQTIRDTTAKLLDSPYYFYSLARQFDIDSKCRENQKIWAKSFSKKQERNQLLFEDESFMNNYADQVFSTINKLGFTFFDECDLQLCFESLDKPLRKKKNKAYLDYYENYLKIINEYMEAKNIEPIVQKTNWIKSLFK